MRVSNVLRKRLREEMMQRPLQIDEFRRIVGMGSHYVSFQKQHEGNDCLFTVEIDGMLLHVHKYVG